MGNEPISLAEAMRTNDILSKLEIDVSIISKRTDVDTDDEWHNPEKEWDRPFHYELEVTAPSGKSVKVAYSKGCGHGKELSKARHKPFRSRACESHAEQLKRLWRKGRIEAKPTDAEVIYALLIDVREFVFDMPSFEEWADGFGWSTDSRKAERVYRTCLNRYYEMQALLGNELLQFLCDSDRVDLEEWE